MQGAQKEVFTVEKVLELDSLPSGSGLARIDSGIFVTGDDSPYLFELDLEYRLRHKWLLLPQWEGSSRIPKSQKPDFEGMSTAEWQGQPYLLLFGSGSKSPERDSLLMVPLNNPEQVLTYALTPVYDLICSREGIVREQLNLEAALIMEDELWMLNRGTNSLIRIGWETLMQALRSGERLRPDQMTVTALELPVIAGKQARFSGACQVPGTQKVLFTASVEDTENWIDDGEILGSIVGIIDQKSLQQSSINTFWPVVNAQGETLLDKLESIEVLEWDGDTLRAIAVTDDDLGGSKLLELKLTGASGLFRE